MKKPFVVVGNIEGEDTEYHKVAASDPAQAVRDFCEILRAECSGNIFVDVVVGISECDSTDLSAPLTKLMINDGEIYE